MLINGLKVFLSCITSLSVTLFTIPRLSHMASMIGLLDYPDSKRKRHSSPKPLVGGIGMAMSLLLSTLFFIPLTDLRGVYSGIGLLIIIGFLDDFKELNHRIKFLAQIAAAALMILHSNTILRTFGELLPNIFLQMRLSVSVIVTIFCVVGVINAINMIDGLDGLAGGVSLIGFAGLSILAYLNHQVELVLFCASLFGAVLGFLRYNWSPSVLFMGDSGSLFLGFSLAFLSIATTQGAHFKPHPVAPLLILAVPIVDAVRIMTKRIIQGRNPFKADRDHIHYIILDRGISAPNVVLIIMGISTLLSAIAIIGTLLNFRDYILFSIFIIYAILHVVMTSLKRTSK